MSRYKEKLKDLENAINRLKDALKESEENPQLSTLKDGVIQRFEFTYELCWKLMKYFLENEGIEDVKSPRSTFREAFQYGLIEDGEDWIDMLKDRNLTSHVYDEELAEEIYEKIQIKYVNMINDMKEILKRKEISSKTLNIVRDRLDMLDIIYKIDVVHFDGLSKKELIENILNDGIEIYRR